MQFFHNVYFHELFQHTPYVVSCNILISFSIIFSNLILVIHIYQFTSFLFSKAGLLGYDLQTQFKCIAFKTMIKLNYFKVCSSTVLTTFTMWCGHHHCLFPKFFSLLQRKHLQLLSNHFLSSPSPVPGNSSSIFYLWICLFQVSYISNNLPKRVLLVGIISALCLQETCRLQ